MSLTGLFFCFVKFSLLCFGGGYMLVPLLTAEFVNANPPILSQQVFSHLISIAQITPGPIGINTATFVGFIQHGWIGGAIATSGLIATSLPLVITISLFLRRYRNSPIVRGFLYGMYPASFGLIMAAAVIFSELSIFNGPLPFGELEKIPDIKVCYWALGITLLSILVLKKKWLSPTWLLIISAALGALCSL